MPWYVKIWQQICPHKNAYTKVVESITTVETTETHCPDCRTQEWRIENP